MNQTEALHYIENHKYFSMDEFHDFATNNNLFGAYVVCIWYKQCDLYPVEILNEYVWIDYDGFTWDMDWDEGGEAYVIGYEKVDALDIIGKGELFDGSET